MQSRLFKSAFLLGAFSFSFFVPSVLFSDENPGRFLGAERWSGTISTHHFEDLSGKVECGVDPKTGRKLGSATGKGRLVVTGHFRILLNPSKELPKEENADDERLNQRVRQMERLLGLTGPEVEGESMSRQWGDNIDSLSTGENAAIVSGAVKGSWKYAVKCPDHSVKANLRGRMRPEDVKKLSSSLGIYVQDGKGYYSVNLGNGDILWSGTVSYRDYSSTTTYRYEDGRWVNPPAGTGLGGAEWVKTSFWGGQSHGRRTIVVAQDMEDPFGLRLDALKLEEFSQKGIDEFLEKFGEVTGRNISVEIPATGSVLAGATTYKKSNRWAHDFHWSFSPSGRSEFEVEVEPVGYDTWRPKGNVDGEKAGHTLLLRARIYDPKTKKAARVKAEKFIFELTESSQMPGVAMNWPRSTKTDHDNDYDLRFEYGADKNPQEDFEIENDGLFIATRKKQDMDKCTVKLSSFDWGAYGKIRVKAIMPGGLEAEGFLKGYPGKKDILVPKREENSWIAEGWKQKKPGAKGKPDDADDENFPKGDGFKGDGFTLYEEYRGFYTDEIKRGVDSDGHMMGNPAKKEVFVINLLAAAYTDFGIMLYQNLTGLRVHVPTELFIRDDRVVNFRNKSIPGHIDQHALRINRDELLDFWGGTASDISTPKWGGEIRINPLNLMADPASDTITIVAHELLHSSCVPHHGEGDTGRAVWALGGDPDAAKILEVRSVVPNPVNKVVDVVYERDRSRRIDPFLFRDTYDLWVASQNGQHSGIQECVMRYNVAQAYKPVAGRSHKRIWKVDDPHKEDTSEPDSLKLCSGKADGSLATKRYGKAINGECQSRVRISDRNTECKPYVDV